MKKTSKQSKTLWRKISDRALYAHIALTLFIFI